MTSHGKLQSTAGRSEEKRRAILDAAEALFLEAGFAAANMDEIARGAGVSKQTIYAHFGTKDDLFAAVVAQVSAAFARTGLDIGRSEPDEPELRERLADYGERQLTIMLDWRVLQLHRQAIAEAAR